MKPRFLVYFLTFLGMLLACLLAPPSAQANGPARLYLQNVPLQDEKLLVANLLLADAADLYGADIQLSFDPAQLRVRDDNPRLDEVQISPGPLLAFDDRFVATNQVDVEAGQINFVFTLLRPAPPINGEGVLATIVFEILADGPYTVEVSHAQLVSFDSQPLPVTVEDLHLSVASELASKPVAAASELPATVSRRWYGLILAAGLGFLLLFIFSIYLKQKLFSSPEAVSVGSVRNIPGRSSSHSASLLIRQAHQLLEHGNLSAAYELFSRAIEFDPARAEAWLGKGLVAQDKTERRICFQRVLALEPKNAVARQALEEI